MAEQSLENDRLLTRAAVLELTGFSYNTIWKYMRADKFPRSLAVFGRVRWREREITSWLENLPRQRLKGDDPGSEPGGQCVNFKKNEGCPQ